MKVAVFRSQLLPYSETFVRNQAECIPADERHLIGLERLSTTLPEPVTTLSVVQSWIMKASRHSPRLAGVVRQSDVILAHFAQDGWRIASIATSTDTPLHIYCHGSDVLTDFNYLKRVGPSFRAMVNNWTTLVDRTTTFIAASDFIADRLLSLGVPEAKVLRHYVGVHIRESKRPEWADRFNAPNFLFVGRLIENKGIDQLLRVFRDTIVRAIPSATLTVVGDGEMGDELRLANQNPSVKFLGRRSQDEVADLMRAAYIVVAPSRQINSGASEGLNQVVLEAQSNGLPVIVNRTGGLPEAVASSDSIVDAGNDSELAERCIDFAQSRTIWTAGSVASRQEFVRSSFALETQTKLLLRKLEAR